LRPISPSFSRDPLIRRDPSSIIGVRIVLERSES
jgi:hypothetical protein